MNRSNSLDQLAAALAAAQAELKPAVKDSVNPYFKSHYADLASVWDVCRGPLARNGLAVTQSPSTGEGGVSVETMMLHSSGQWIASTITIPVAKQDAQGIGSVITYARRYSLAAIVGVSFEDEDDDGETDAQVSRSQASGAAKLKPEGKEQAMTALREAAVKGLVELERVWRSLLASQREACKSELGAMKEEARRHDTPAV